MAVAGVTIERTAKGKPTFVRIDLRKHANIIPLLKEGGIEIDEPVKWTAEMRERKRGEIVSRSLEELLR